MNDIGGWDWMIIEYALDTQTDSCVTRIYSGKTGERLLVSVKRSHEPKPPAVPVVLVSLYKKRQTSKWTPATYRPVIYNYNQNSTVGSRRTDS